MDPELALLCQCPQCGRPLVPSPNEIVCSGCSASFPLVGGIPCFFVDAEKQIAEWRRQVSHYEHLVANSVKASNDALAQLPLLPSTRKRIERIARANQDNCARVMDIFRSAGLVSEESAGESPAARDFAIIEYYDHVLRDWASDRLDGERGVGGAGSAENTLAGELVMEVLGNDRHLGRTVVLGAGACRLAYDLHVICRPELTVLIDTSPLLLLLAHRILFGGGLKLYEFPAVPKGTETVCVEHELSPPRGSPDHFHLLLADAFRAPLGLGTFDTVITPWFIDIVPVDARDTMGIIHGLLRPGGRWVNYGPLNYAHEQPIAERYTKEELLELCPLAGFAIEESRTARVPLLHSRANARQRTEQAIVFAVRKEVCAPPDPGGDAPPWLLFAHLPIPRFAGLDGYQPEHPLLAYIARQIDGTRTLGDIALRMIEEHGARREAAVRGTRGLLTLLYRSCRAQHSS